MRRAHAVACAALAACSFKSHGGPDAPGGDDAPRRLDAAGADGDSGGGSDAPPKPADCLAAWQEQIVTLGAPVELTELATSETPGQFERDPFLTPDELTIYFSSNENGDPDTDIFTATRGSAGEQFGDAQIIFGSNFDEDKLTIGGDGKTAFYAAAPVGSDDADLFQVDLSTGAVAGTKKQLAAVDTKASQLDPWLSVDLDRLYYSDTVTAGSAQRLALATRANATMNFNAGTNGPFDAIDSDGALGRADPSLSLDETVVLFSEASASGARLFYATRGSASDNFGSAVSVPITPTTHFVDGDPHLGSDACSLYFASDRDDSDLPHIYVTHVILPP